MPAVDAKNEITDPLDYSFCRLNNIEGMRFVKNVIKVSILSHI